MPPAFVLSQDQTLKFVSHTNQARSCDRRPERHELQGADTCTVKRNGYEGHASPIRRRGARAGCGNRLVLTGIRSLKTPGPGAVAHMSLHLNQRCQRAVQQKRRTTIAPRLVVGGRLSGLYWRPMAGRLCVGSPSVKRHIWMRRSRVNTLLQLYFKPRVSPPFSALPSLRCGVSGSAFAVNGG